MFSIRSRSRRLSLSLLGQYFLSFIILALSTLQASAQVGNFDRAITFGDSLSDNGNLGATAPAFAPPVPPYFGGVTGLARFSNGPVWIEQLVGTMNSPFVSGPAGVLGNTNLAFGGARADTDVPAPPGVPDQVGTFQAFGGVIGANDLVTVWAGANDVFQFFDVTPVPTQATITANSLNTAQDQLLNVNTLIGLGAKTLLVPNLPNIGAAPSFNGTPQGAQGGLLASLVYNNALSAGLAGIVAPGVNIIQMDVFGALQAVAANPAAFGFTNVTDPCFNGLSVCAATQADQNKFLFWDGVHPTQAGHALLAQYAAYFSTHKLQALPFSHLAKWPLRYVHRPRAMYLIV